MTRSNTIRVLVALALTAFSAAQAAPIGLSIKTASAAHDGLALRVIDTLGTERHAIADSTQLKIWSLHGDGSLDFRDTGNLGMDAAPTFERIRPVLSTQAMSVRPDVTMAMPLGGTSLVPIATGVAPPAAGAGGNNVVVVAEPGILMLTGLGLILAGLARRRR